MSRFDFIASFYKQEHDRTSFINGISSILSTEPLDVRLVPFSVKKNFITRFPFNLGDNKEVIELNAYNGVFCIRMKYTTTEYGQKKSHSGRFFIFNHPDYERVKVLISLEGTHFWNKCVKSLLGASYPQVYLTFIPHDMMRSILEEFKVKNRITELVVKRAYFRLRMGEEEKRIRSVPFASWPDRSLDKVFDWVYELDGWFNSIQLEACVESMRLAKINISRNGTIKTDGIFKAVFESIVMKLCKNININNVLFDKRARSDNEQLEVRPLAIDFGRDLFRSDPGNEKFIEIMRNYSMSSVSVQHGNPYLHLSVLDYYDGSVFDVWGLGEGKIYIVPQMKGTVSSIKRIIHHIFDNYAEGEIKDYEELK